MTADQGQAAQIMLLGIEKAKESYIGYRIPLDKSFIPEIEQSAMKGILATKDVTNRFDPDGDVEKVPFVASKEGDDIWDDSFMASLENYLDLPALDSRDFGTKQFFATVVVLKNDTGTWLLISKRDVQHVGRRGFIGRFGPENRITKVEYPIYVFSDRYHVIEHDGDYYVNLYNSFDSLFRAPADLKPKVTKMTTRISSVLSLTHGSAEKLIEIASEKRSIAKKLDALNRHIDRINPTSEKVKRALKILSRKENDYFVGNDLSFTPENAEDLLRLLNEDYFLGLISGLPYAADRKTTETTEL